MPRAKLITDAKAERVLRDIIDGKGDKDAKIKAIKLWMERKREKEAKRQFQRELVTKRIVNDEALQKLLDWSPYYPKRHEKQIEVLNCQADDIVICAGKRGGKTALCAYFALKGLLEGKNILVVAPSYLLAEKILEYLILWSAKFKGEMRISFRPPQKVTTIWGARLDCRSAEQPDQIMGSEYDIVIADECSKISENIHHRYIRPATGIKIGKHYYISTPFGRNWFWRVWRKACESGGGFQWKSIDNPYFGEKKWEEEKKNLPDFVFRQEYGAEFLEEAMVFQGFGQCLKEYQFPEEYNPNHLYRIGIDLGKYDTWTAVEVMDLMTNRSVECLRFQGDWNIQKERITSLADKYGQCPIWIDATSITTGDAYVDELSNAGYNITGYKLLNVTKRQLIEKLIVLIQNRNITFPDDKSGTPDSQEFNTEMRAYSYELSLAGNLIYKAPQGEYEDCVIARGLACWELENKPLPELKKGQTEVYKFPNQTF